MQGAGLQIMGQRTGSAKRENRQPLKQVNRQNVAAKQVGGAK